MFPAVSGNKEAGRGEEKTPVPPVEFNRYLSVCPHHYQAPAAHIMFKNPHKNTLREIDDYIHGKGKDCENSKY